MRSAMTIIVSVSLLFAGAVAARAQGAHASTLDGIISTVGGAQPAGSIRIRLERFGITIQERFSTDGRFQFRGVAPGSYTIVVEAPDYATANTVVEVPGESFLLIKLGPQIRPDAGKAETRSVLTYLFDANRLDEAEQMGLKLHRDDKHSPDIHLVLVKVYLRQQKKAELARELELYIKEAPPGRLRDEAKRVLALAK